MESDISDQARSSSNCAVRWPSRRWKQSGPRASWSGGAATCESVCMARLNVDLPGELVERTWAERHGADCEGASGRGAVSSVRRSGRSGRGIPAGLLPG